MALGRNEMIIRCLKAIHFILENKYFTTADLADHMEVTKNTGRNWLMALSIAFPIYTVREGHAGKEPVPALFTLLKEEK